MPKVSLAPRADLVYLACQESLDRKATEASAYPGHPERGVKEDFRDCQESMALLDQKENQVKFSFIGLFAFRKGYVKKINIFLLIQNIILHFHKINLVILQCTVHKLCKVI